MTLGQNIKQVHFIGIGGIGVSALAKLFLSWEASVSGSDKQSSEMLEELQDRGADIFIGHQSENIAPGAEVVIYSSAISEANPEFRAAKENQIPMYSYAEALGEIMQKYFSIAVSGTNGKTTTVSMLGKILEAAEIDPFVVVGGKVSGWDGNLRLPERGEVLERDSSKESVFVAEVCEYKRNMLNFSPDMILLTNIVEDHLDYYLDLEDILEAFKDFADKLPDDGYLFYNADDAQSVRLLENINTGKHYSYGIESEADLKAQNIKQIEQGGLVGQSCVLFWKGEKLGDMFLPLPGRFNISNMLGAVLVALVLDVSFESIQNALAEFQGTWRRFQKIGEYQNALVVSDYAHHPLAVAGTIEAAKEFFPDKRVLAVFQPHQHNRTKKFFNDFVESLGEADATVLPEIYAVAGREEEDDISSKDLSDALKEKGKTSFYASNLQEAEDCVSEMASDYGIILFMGAGDIHSLAVEVVGGNKDFKNSMLTQDINAI